jgi:hypothetical protein
MSDPTLHDHMPRTHKADADFLLEQHIDHLQTAVERELRQAPEGLSELGLIRILQQPPWKLIGDIQFDEPEHLYPVHFLLFHVLYRLRDQLAGTGTTLTISPLGIVLSKDKVVAGQGLPEPEDKLRRFYLDLSQYRLPEESIQRMMDDFWAGRHGVTPALSEALAAAKNLGFSSIPETFQEVKHQFRRAVMRAHPDRGGDTETVQSLNQAFATLKAHFSLGG